MKRSFLTAAVWSLDRLRSDWDVFLSRKRFSIQLQQVLHKLSSCWVKGRVCFEDRMSRPFLHAPNLKRLWFLWLPKIMASHLHTKHWPWLHSNAEQPHAFDSGNAGVWLECCCSVKFSSYFVKCLHSAAVLNHRRPERSELTTAAKRCLLWSHEADRNSEILVFVSSSVIHTDFMKKTQ